MKRLFLEAGEAVTDELAAYVAVQANTLSLQDDDSIDMYTDEELSNPDATEYLDNEQDEVTDEIASVFGFESSRLSTHFKSLGIDAAASPQLRIRLFRWRKLKERIRKIICAILAEAGGGDLDWKDIIKKALTALIPTFIAGIPGFIVAIIIGFSAKAIKNGVGNLCS